MVSADHHAIRPPHHIHGSGPGDLTAVGTALELTEPRREIRPTSTNAAIADATAIEENAEVNLPDRQNAKISIRSILVPRVLLPILNYGFLAFTDQCVVVLLPLMYSSPISQGGLGFGSFTIGIVQGVAGVVSGVLQIFTFAWMHRKFGTKRLYIASFASYLFCICAFPLLSFLAKRDGRVSAAVWSMIVVQNAAYAATFMTWGQFVGPVRLLLPVLMQTFPQVASSCTSAMPHQTSTHWASRTDSRRRLRLLSARLPRLQRPRCFLSRWRRT